MRSVTLHQMFCNTKQGKYSIPVIASKKMFSFLEELQQTSHWSVLPSLFTVSFRSWIVLILMVTGGSAKVAFDRTMKIHSLRG